jgi:hypothetical protein
MTVAQGRGESASRRPGLNEHKNISLSPLGGWTKGEGFPIQQPPSYSSVGLGGHSKSLLIGGPLGLLMSAPGILVRGGRFVIARFGAGYAVPKYFDPIDVAISERQDTFLAFIIAKFQRVP